MSARTTTTTIGMHHASEKVQHLLCFIHARVRILLPASSVYFFLSFCRFSYVICLVLSKWTRRKGNKIGAAAAVAQSPLTRAMQLDYVYRQYRLENVCVFVSVFLCKLCVDNNSHSSAEKQTHTTSLSYRLLLANVATKATSAAEKDFELKCLMMHIKREQIYKTNTLHRIISNFFRFQFFTFSAFNVHSRSLSFSLSFSPSVRCSLFVSLCRRLRLYRCAQQCTTCW